MHVSIRAVGSLESFTTTIQAIVTIMSKPGFKKVGWILQGVTSLKGLPSLFTSFVQKNKCFSQKNLGGNVYDSQLLGDALG